MSLQCRNYFVDKTSSRLFEKEKNVCFSWIWDIWGSFFLLIFFQNRYSEMEKKSAEIRPSKTFPIFAPTHFFTEEIYEI